MIGLPDEHLHQQHGVKARGADLPRASGFSRSDELEPVAIKPSWLILTGWYLLKFELLLPSLLKNLVNKRFHQRMRFSGPTRVLSWTWQLYLREHWTAITVLLDLLAMPADFCLERATAIAQCFWKDEVGS